MLKANQKQDDIKLKIVVHQKIARLLRDTGNSECIEKAQSLEKEGYRARTLDLRKLGLKPNDVLAICDILKQEKAKNSDLIQSISFSYNDLIGDKGASVLARSLPSSICELGLVDCGIGDEGGREILHWIKTLPNLNMICIEQNNFSDQLKMEYGLFKKKAPDRTVVF
ncbi:MAG: hypothetical protein HKN39_01910 [Flavobacteriales bacterium]|nr:hypothetical protein [Flavobacteriales bacterium]